MDSLRVLRRCELSAAHHTVSLKLFTEQNDTAEIGTVPPKDTTRSTFTY